MKNLAIFLLICLFVCFGLFAVSVLISYKQNRHTTNPNPAPDTVQVEPKKELEKPKPPVVIDYNSVAYFNAVDLEAKYVKEVRKGNRNAFIAASYMARSSADFYLEAGDVESYERMMKEYRSILLYLD